MWTTITRLPLFQQVLRGYPVSKPYSDFLKTLLQCFKPERLKPNPQRRMRLQATKQQKTIEIWWTDKFIPPRLLFHIWTIQTSNSNFAFWSSEFWRWSGEGMFTQSSVMKMYTVDSRLVGLFCLLVGWDLKMVEWRRVHPTKQDCVIFLRLKYN